MKRFIKTLLAALLSLPILAGATSCLKEELSPKVEPPTQTDAKTYKFGFTRPDPVVVETKGNVIAARDLTIQAIYIKIFQNGNLIYSQTKAAATAYSAGNTLWTDTLTEGLYYDVFCWTSSVSDKNSDIFDNSDDINVLKEQTFGFRARNWDSTFDDLYPMSYYGHLTAYELDMLDGAEDETIIIPLQYLFADVNLTVTYDDMLQAMCPTHTVSGTTYGITLGTPKLYGVYQRVGVFSSDYNEGAISWSDYDENCNQAGCRTSNTTAHFLVPECLGGTLLPDNNSSFGKNKEAIEALGYNEYSFPYIEVPVTYKTYLALGTVTKTYRFYLGGDATSNFDTKRGYQYNLTLYLGYDGLDYTGTWKISGAASSVTRALNLAYHHDRDFAQPGERIYIHCDYSVGGTDATTLKWGTANGGNGYTVETDETKINNYISSGTWDSYAHSYPYGNWYIGNTKYPESGGTSCTWGLECQSCHHVYPVTWNWSTETEANRTNWVESTWPLTSTYFRSCTYCNQVIYSIRVTGAAFTQYAADKNAVFSTTDSPTEDGVGGGLLKRVTLSPAYIKQLYVPSTATVGDEFTVYATTRDGKVRKSLPFVVRNANTPSFKSGSKNFYVAQKKLLKLSTWDKSTYGNNPSFQFEISCTAPNGTADATVATLSAGSNNQEVYINCQKSGSYTVTVKYNNVTTGCTTSGTIKYPHYGKPRVTDGGAGQNVIRVANGGTSTSVYPPKLYITNAAGEEEEFTDYDNSLYLSYIGSTSSTLLDNNGWVSYSSGAPGSVYLNHAYKNGVVSNANLCPWDEPATSMDRIRFSASSANVRRTGVVSDGDTLEDRITPVCFEAKYAAAGLNKSRGYLSNIVYTLFVCEEGLEGSNPSTRWSINGLRPTTNNGFYAMRNGSSYSIDNLVTFPHGAGGSYACDWNVSDKQVGDYGIFLRIQGRSSDYYDFRYARLSLHKKYIGSYTLTTKEAFTAPENINHTLEHYIGDKDYWTYYSYANSDTYNGPRNNGYWPVINREEYYIDVTANNIISGLFTKKSRSVLPTEGMYDPNDIAEGTDQNTYCPILYPLLNFGMFGLLIGDLMQQPTLYSHLYEYSQKTFYYSAHHNIAIGSNRYRVTINPWFVANWTFWESGIAVACKGYGINKYKSFNSPLFGSKSSPQTISGVTWTKISDDGTTAEWQTSDGYTSCIFKYGAWE